MVRLPCHRYRKQTAWEISKPMGLSRRESCVTIWSRRTCLATSIHGKEWKE
jgi:hypothetical protein